MQYEINSICIFEGWFCTVLSRFFPFLIAGSYRGIRNVKYVKRDGKLYTYFNYFLLGPQYSSSNMKKMERIWKCRVSWIYHFNICQNENTNLVAATIYYNYKSRLHEMFWAHCEWKMHDCLKTEDKKEQVWRCYEAYRISLNTKSADIRKFDIFRWGHYLKNFKFYVLNVPPILWKKGILFKGGHYIREDII